ncbi:MAG TPA: acyltransferase domain-containing protein [Burkholderiales bacterium]|nr:acyltransferase domain-containing protein [Betaproteobacteria bacterium]HQR52029.1 acyltransferase domain-containing protein [Burkholderiales bacterium]
MGLCLLCPGQGSQSPDMFARLLGDALVAPHVARLARGMDGDALAVAADPRQCFENRHAQPLVCLFALSVAAALRELDVEPDLVAGYSVGELAAYGVAGALPAEDVVAAAAARARAMDACAARGSGMLAVRGVRRAEIEARAAAHALHIAIRNGDDHVIVAGVRPNLAALADELGRHSGAHVVNLPITVPAHSPLLQPAVDPFRAVLQGLPWQRTPVPVIAGIDASIVRDSGCAIDTLSRQVAATIEWARVTDVAVELGASVFFELGPGNALVRMLCDRHRGVPARSAADFVSVGGAVSWLRHHLP